MYKKPIVYIFFLSSAAVYTLSLIVENPIVAADEKSIVYIIMKNKSFLFLLARSELVGVESCVVRQRVSPRSIKLNVRVALVSTGYYYYYYYGERAYAAVVVLLLQQNRYKKL